MSQLVPVTYRDIPLVGAAKHWSAPLGSSVLDIVKDVPELPCYFSEVGFVCVNGEEVPRAWWQYVRPKAHSVVTLHVRLEQGNTQKILASVAALAVVLIAAIAAPLIAGALAFPAGSALFLGTQAAVGIIGSVGGALLYSALAPPPAATPASAGPTQDLSVKPAALSGNTLRAGDNLARVLGYRRVFPSFISQPVVELVGLREVVEGVYGLAGPHLIDHIYAADVDVSTMQEVSTQITQGFPNSIPQTLVPRQGFVVAPNTDLSQPLFDTTNTNRALDPANPTADLSFYHRFTSRVAPDEFWLSLAFTEGLINTSGNQLACPVRVRFRIRGTTTWTDCPEVHFRTSSATALQVTVKLMWQAPSSSALVTPDAQTGGWVAYFSTPNQNAGTPPTGAFTANSYFYKGSGDTNYNNANVSTTGLQNMGMYTDRVEFYLDPNVFPQAPYEVEVRRGQAYNANNWSQANYTYNPGTGAVVYDLFGYAIIGGNTGWIEPQGNLRNKASIIRHTSIWHQPPVAAGAPIATIAVKAIGRSIQQLSCDAGGYVDQTLAGLPGVFDTSQNPADHYRDVLVGNLGAFPLQASQIDNLVGWYNDCNSNGYNINAVIQGMKQMDVLKLVAAAGYAKPIQSETWGVAEDFDRTGLVPTQIFTPRNLSNFQWAKAFHPYIDGLRVKFDDALNLFVETEVIVLDPDLQTGGVRLEDIRYDTIVQSGDAIRRALFDLRQAKSRLEFYSGTADIENLVCRVGDLVGVNYDVLSSEVGYARVISITTAAGNITTMTMDDDFPQVSSLLLFFNQPPLNFFNDPTLNFFNKPSRTGVVIRCSDGTFLTKEVTVAAGPPVVLTFVTPFTNPGTIVKNTLVGVGPLGSETLRLLVQQIAPKKDFTADITFVDEAPELFASKPTSLLLHFDGTNGQTTTVDSSSSPTTVTMTVATLTTANFKFGTASCTFNGSTALVTAAEQGNDFFCGRDFTIDWWFRTASATNGCMCHKGAALAFGPWRVDATAAGNIAFSSSSNGSSYDIANGLVVCPNQLDNVFHHFAVARQGNYFFFFLDGNIVFSFYSPLVPFYVQNQIIVGSNGAGGVFFNGQIDEFRYTNGLARWISSFNPPIAAGNP